MENEKAILFYYEGQDEKTFLSGSRDDCNQPYADLRDYLSTIGVKFEMTPRRPLEKYMYICFYNMFSVRAFNLRSGLKRTVSRFLRGEGCQSLYQRCLKKGLEDKMVLFLSEPESVVPENYPVNDHRNFRYVFTWSTKLLNYDQNRYKTFTIPAHFSSNVSHNIDFANKKLLVDISGNKCSKHPRQLYSARRSDIQFFERNIPNHFDLYGFGWGDKRSYDKHSYTSYRGIVESKKEVLQRYKFALCYENILEESNYISNRIFDIFAAGCVPIYWGGRYISEFVWPSTFVNRADFRSCEDLVKYIVSMNERQHTSYLNDIQNYLTSSNAKQFGSKAFFENFARTLQLK